MVVCIDLSSRLMSFTIEPDIRRTNRADDIIWRGYAEAGTDGLLKISRALIPSLNLGECSAVHGFIRAMRISPLLVALASDSQRANSGAIGGAADSSRTCPIR